MLPPDPRESGGKVALGPGTPDKPPTSHNRFSLDDSPPSVKAVRHLILPTHIYKLGALPSQSGRAIQPVDSHILHHLPELLAGWPSFHPECALALRTPSCRGQRTCSAALVCHHRRARAQGSDDGISTNMNERAQSRILVSLAGHTHSPLCRLPLKEIFECLRLLSRGCVYVSSVCLCRELSIDVYTVHFMLAIAAWRLILHQSADPTLAHVVTDRQIAYRNPCTAGHRRWLFLQPSQKSLQRLVLGRQL